MADELEVVEKQEPPLFWPAWPGYFQTKHRLKRMTRLRDLIIHNERWATHIDLAQPLEALFPGENLKSANYATTQRIDQEIRQIRRMVWWDLHYIGVDTVVVWKGRRILEHKEPDKKFDVIMDYERLPRQENGHPAFQAVIDVLEQGIGLCKGRLRRAKMEMFNPIMWAAYAIRIPITVMERAGFGANKKTQDMLLGGYARFMRIAMAGILGLLLLLLGFKVPWKHIVDAIIDTIFK